MSTDLYELLKGLMNRVVKADVMTTAVNALKICEVKIADAANQLHYKKMDIGFSADKMLQKLVKDKICSERQDMEFRQSAKAFVVAIVSRLLTKCPLTYTLVRNMPFLDPRLMASKKEDCQSKLKRVLTVLVEANRVDERDCDDILHQYRNYLDEIQTADISVFSNFKPSESRIDTLLYQTMGNNGDYVKLWNVVYKLLLFSHGQSTVERGFSINRQIEVENRKEHSYVAQRTVNVSSSIFFKKPFILPWKISWSPWKIS